MNNTLSLYGMKKDKYNFMSLIMRLKDVTKETEGKDQLYS